MTKETYCSRQQYHRIHHFHGWCSVKFSTWFLKWLKLKVLKKRRTVQAWNQKKTLLFVLMKYCRLRVMLFTSFFFLKVCHCSAKMTFNIILIENTMIYQHCKSGLKDCTATFRKPLMSHIYIHQNYFLCISKLVRK